MVGPSRGVGAGGGSFPPASAKRGSSETIGTLFCIESMYRHPYTFESTLHCQRSTCGVCTAILCAHVARSHVKTRVVQVADTARYQSVQNWQLLTI